MPRTAPRHDFTHGPIVWPLIVFALPLLASGVLQTLNASVNAFWVGRYLGESALTAVSNGNTLLFFLLGAVFGTSMAATMLAAHAMGAKDLPRAKRVAGTGATFFLALMGLVAGAAFPLAPAVLHLMQTPEDAMAFAVAYLRIVFLSLPVSSLFTFLTGMARASGDARTPFLFQLLSVCIDIVLTPVLIFGMGAIPALGVAGSAAATFISQSIALGAMLLHLYRSRHPLMPGRHELGTLRPASDIVRTLIVKGLPMGAQILVVSSSMVVLVSIVNRFGSEVAAAYGAAAQIWTYVQMPAMALSGAVSIAVAQNIGAGRWDRAERGIVAGVLLTMGAAAGLAAFLFVTGTAVPGLFLPQGTNALRLASHINDIAAWSFSLLGGTFVLFGAMRATGAVGVPLAISFAALWLIRLPFAEVATAWLGPDAVWWSIPLGSSAALGLAVLYYSFGTWKRATLGPAAAR